MYRFNTAATPESAYVYVCVGGAHHVHADPATMRLDARLGASTADHRSRILEHRPLRAGGFFVATA